VRNRNDVSLGGGMHPTEVNRGDSRECAKGGECFHAHPTHHGELACGDRPASVLGWARVGVGSQGGSVGLGLDARGLDWAGRRAVIMMMS